MKKINITYLAVIISIAVVIFGSCKKTDEFVNPFDEYSTDPLYETPSFTSLPSSNFAYLHETIFKPTCASSGCHDGNFEPDFRTINSSYNSIVFHPVITNDPSATFVYRVKPGDANLSLLHERLITALPNTSGIMAPDYIASWQVNKQTKINNIKSWINNGALDMFGNQPEIGNQNPVVTGFQVFQDGNTTTPLGRANGSGVTPIVIPNGNVDLWFSISDDNTSATNLIVNKVKISEQMYGFENLTPGTANISGSLTASDFNNNSTTFTHKYDFDASSYPSGTILFVRIYVQDADHSEPIETPNAGTNKQILYLFSMYIN